MDYIQKPQATVFKKYRRKLRRKKRYFRHAQIRLIKRIYKKYFTFGLKSKKSKYKPKYKSKRKRFKTKAEFNAFRTYLGSLKQTRRRRIQKDLGKNYKKYLKTCKKTNYKLFRNFIKIIGFNKKFLQQLRIQRYYYISTRKKLRKIHKQRQRLKILKYFMKGILKNRKVYRPRIWYFFKRSRRLARRIFRKRKGFIRIRRYIRKRFLRAVRKFKRKTRRKLQGLKGIRYRRGILRRKRYRRKLFRHRNRRKYVLKQRGIHGQRIRRVKRYRKHIEDLKKKLPGSLKTFKKFFKCKRKLADKKKNESKIRKPKEKKEYKYVKELRKKKQEILKESEKKNNKVNKNVNKKGNDKGNKKGNDKNNKKGNNKVNKNINNKNNKNVNNKDNKNVNNKNKIPFHNRRTKKSILLVRVI